MNQKHFDGISHARMNPPSTYTGRSSTRPVCHALLLKAPSTMVERVLVNQKHFDGISQARIHLLLTYTHYEKKLTKNIRPTDILQIYTSI